jgi:hypothetical protein
MHGGAFIRLCHWARRDHVERRAGEFAAPVVQSGASGLHSPPRYRSPATTDAQCPGLAARRPRTANSPIRRTVLPHCARDARPCRRYQWVIATLHDLRLRRGMSWWWMARGPLCAVEVDEVWRRWRSGQAVKVLAREMRCNPSTVRDLLSGPAGSDRCGVGGGGGRVGLRPGCRCPLSGTPPTQRRPSGRARVGCTVPLGGAPATAPISTTQSSPAGSSSSPRSTSWVGRTAQPRSNSRPARSMRLIWLAVTSIGARERNLGVMALCPVLPRHLAIGT